MKANVDSLIENYMESYRISGLSIGIVKKGSPYLVKGYGYTSTEMNYETTENTLFHTASITKLFTATAIMQFVERNEINLSDRVIDHLPDFRMKDKQYKEITIEHLLTHSSGLPWEHSFKNKMDDSTALRKFVMSLDKSKLNFPPGEKFDGSTYSNVAYSILGLIIEQKSGMSYTDYIRKYILEPTDMSTSTFTHETIPPEIKAQPQLLSGKSREINRFNLSGEIKDENPVLKYPEKPIVLRDTYGRQNEHDPNDGLISSAQELSNWTVHLLKIYSDSTKETNAVLAPQTLKNMWSLKRSIKDKETSLGICWWRYPDENFGTYVFHVGREPGFSSTLMIFPEQNVSITILSNAMYADQLVWNTLPFEIMEILKMKKK
jgi:CubicO group peptidase (beta-lactamase class C family)